MKKTLLVLPLAILLANCSSTRSTTSTSSNTGINASASTTTSGTNTGVSGSVSGDASGANSSASMGTSSGNGATASASGSMTGSASANGSHKNWGTASSAPINWDVYDPNNYMMNPEKYRKPYEMGKTGGWTYNKDWRRNTNFTAEAVGQWQLELTPEVAANWMPDTRRPEMYESFWTPEAVMARYQASVAAAAKTRDSLAAIAAIANANTATAKGRKGAGMASSTGTWAAGGGTTGVVGTGGLSTTNTTTSAAATTTDNSASKTDSTATTPFVMTAVNGNNFKLPTLNMFIDNGSFTAYTGCNNAVGTIVVNGSSLHFDEATPSTNVECIGGFDQTAFLDRLRRADSYDVVNNQFRIKQGEKVLMVFSKPGTKAGL